MQPANTPTHVILGASGAIGSDVARRLAAPGSRLAIAGRNGGALASLQEELARAGADVSVRAFDATAPGEIERFVADHADGLASITNCVGSILLKPAHLTTDDELHRVLALNLLTAFACVRAAAKAMRASGGSLVLLSSAAARTGMPNHEAIAAAKAAVIGLTLSGAATYASAGIRINAVAPGLVRSAMSAPITGNEGALKASVSMHAMGRIGEPADVGALIAWLHSPQAAWVTGQVMGADGGLATLRPRVKV